MHALCLLVSKMLLQPTHALAAACSRATVCFIASAFWAPTHLRQLRGGGHVLAQETLQQNQLLQGGREQPSGSTRAFSYHRAWLQAILVGSALAPCIPSHVRRTHLGSGIVRRPQRRQAGAQRMGLARARRAAL